MCSDYGRQWGLRQARVKLGQKNYKSWRTNNFDRILFAERWPGHTTGQRTRLSMSDAEWRAAGYKEAAQ